MCPEKRLNLRAFICILPPAAHVLGGWRRQLCVLLGTSPFITDMALAQLPRDHLWYFTRLLKIRRACMTWGPDVPSARHYSRFIGFYLSSIEI